ncbi:beta strand repeat-containing protein [Verrucomicrobiota bacterium sgz303538]
MEFPRLRPPYPARILSTTIAALLASGCFSPNARAANTWDGGGTNANWSTAQNWDDNLVPAFPQPLTFTGTANLATVNDLAAGVTVSGITFDATTGPFKLAGNAITLAGGITDDSAELQTINLPITVNATQTVSVNFGGALTIGPGANGSGVISGTGGLTKAGSGTLTLGAANTYTGTTTLDGGTLVYTADNTGVQSLTFGLTNTSIETSNLDLTGANLTTTSLTVQTNTGAANSITIGDGKTLTVTGATTVGVPSLTAGGATVLTITGNKFVAGSANSTGHFTVGVLRSNNDTGSDPTATVDMSGLKEFSFNATTTGELRVGYGGNTAGTLRLANTSNTITARAVQIGASNGQNAGGASTLSLGAGTNILYADTFNVATSKANGTINFFDATGTLVIRAQNGTGRANITVGAVNQGSTGNTATGTLAFTGHEVDILANTLQIARRTVASGTNATGTVSFDTGTIDVTSLDMAFRNSGNAGEPGVVGTLNLGGTGLLKVGSSFSLASSTDANVASGIFNITGGTAEISANITRGAGAGTRATINLQGGTLNMKGNSIGDSVNTITLNASTGTLKNIGQINGGAGLITTGFDGDILILDGTNSYTGGTTISAGTLQIGTGGTSGTLGAGPVTNNGKLALNHSGTLTVADAISGTGTVQHTGTGTTILGGTSTYTGPTDINTGTLSVTGSLTSAVNVNANGTLAGAGDGVTTGKVGNVTMAAGSSLQPGATGVLGDVGKLTLASLTVNGGDLRFDLGATSDQVNVIGTASFLGASIIIPNAAAPSGTYTLLTAGTLTLGTNPTINAPTGTRKTFTPDYSTPNTIKLVVTGASKTLAWTGSANGSWDIGASGTLNWSDGVATDRFFNADAVTFGDGPANRTVMIGSTAVQPSSVTVNNSTGNDYTISGAGGIGGSASLTKSGTGALTLNSANTYSGGTTLNAGTLKIGHAAALGTGTLTIAGGTLDNTSGAPLTLTANNAQKWNGNFTFTGSNNLNLGTGPVTLGASPVVTVTANTLSVGGMISGDFGLTKSGNGALTLAGANTYTGGTTLTAGTLNLNHSSALGSGTFTISGGTIDNTSGSTVTLNGNNPQNWNADFAFAGTNDLNVGTGPITLNADRTVTVAAGTLTVGGIISDGFNLGKAGTGKLVLSAVNGYFGTTTINAGTVVVTNAANGNSSLGSLGGSAVSIAAGATLDLSGNLTAQALNFGTKQFNIEGTGVGGNGAIVNNGVSQFNTFQRVTLTNDATIGGSQRYDIRGTGSLLNLDGHTLTKIGSNQVSLVGTTVNDGNIVVNQGTFSIETTTSIPDFGTGKTITFNDGTTGQFYQNRSIPSAVTRPIVVNGNVQFGNASNNDNAIIGSNITLNGDLTVTNLNNSNNTSSLTLAGNITESGGARSLTKNGPSTLVVTGNNSYTGGTTINAGRLQVGDGAIGGSLGSGAVANNALLAFNPGIEPLTFSNPISGTGTTQKDGFGTLTLSGNSSYTGATTVNDGTLVVSGSLSGTSNVAVNFGTLKLGAANRLADLATLTLGTGTFDTNGFSETLGALTLNGAGLLELGLGTSVLHFADSTLAVWFGSLSITNWSGSVNGGGTDQIFFGNNNSALTPEQIGLISFVDPFGPGSGTIGARMLPSGELVAIPEPSTAAVLLGGLGALLCGRRRDRRRSAHTSLIQ